MSRRKKTAKGLKSAAPVSSPIAKGDIASGAVVASAGECANTDAGDGKTGSVEEPETENNCPKKPNEVKVTTLPLTKFQVLMIYLSAVTAVYAKIFFIAFLASDLPGHLGFVRHESPKPMVAHTNAVGGNQALEELLLDLWRFNLQEAEAQGSTEDARRRFLVQAQGLLQLVAESKSMGPSRPTATATVPVPQPEVKATPVSLADLPAEQTARTTQSSAMLSSPQQHKDSQKKNPPTDVQIVAQTKQLNQVVASAVSFAHAPLPTQKSPSMGTSTLHLTSSSLPFAFATRDASIVAYAKKLKSCIDFYIEGQRLHGDLYQRSDGTNVLLEHTPRLALRSVGTTH